MYKYYLLIQEEIQEIRRENKEDAKDLKKLKSQIKHFLKDQV